MDTRIKNGKQKMAESARIKMYMAQTYMSLVVLASGIGGDKGAALTHGPIMTGFVQVVSRSSAMIRTQTWRSVS